MPGFWWHLVTAALYGLAGLVMLVNPLAGVLTLTVILTAYLIAGGIVRIVLAFGHRETVPSAWGCRHGRFSGMRKLISARAF